VRGLDAMIDLEVRLHCGVVHDLWSTPLRRLAFVPVVLFLRFPGPTRCWACILPGVDR
jgi:hypothetical protein